MWIWRSPFLDTLELETASCFWNALQEGLILPQNDIYQFYVGEVNQAINQESSEIVAYKFLHDRVQQAAYSLWNLRRHRLKANEQRPAIEVITEYGNLPQIEYFTGQLNQAFMNIIANAINAS